MVDDQSRPTRRKFVATSALLLGAGAGCVNSDTDEDPAEESTPTPTETPTPTPDATETETEAETETEQAPAEDRTVELEPNVTPAYQGAFVRSGRTLDNFEDLSHWDVRKGGELAADAGHRFSGMQSLAFEGTGRTVVTADYRGDPVDLTDEDLSLAAKFDAPTDYQPKFYVIAQAPDHDNKVLFGTPYNANKNAGWQRYDLAPIEAQGTPDLSDIRLLKLVVNPPDGTPVKFNVDDLRAHPKPDKGKIVFRFDDTHAIHYEDYFPVLQEHGYPGMEAVVKSAVGNRHRLSVQQLLELQEAGWDLCHHTTAHQNITHMSQDQLRRDIEELDDWFDRYGIEQGTNMHVYTFGAYDGDSLAVIDEHFDMAFGGGGRTNYNLSNPLTVNSINVEEGIEETKGEIDKIAKHRSLGVLMVHDAYDRQEFAEIVEYVAANEDRIDVISASDLNDHVQSLQ